MKKKIRRNNNLIKLTGYVLLATMLMSGCSSEVSVGGGSVREPQEAPINVGASADDYSSYVKGTIDNVSGANATPEPTAVVDNTRIVDVEVDELPARGVYVSSSENLPEDSGVVPEFKSEDLNAEDEDEEDNNKEDKKSDSDEDEEDSEEIEYNAYGNPITPDEFDVGKCCIYINGEIDEQYGSDIITALNKARTDLGYDALDEKKGLDTCANRRTREISCFLSHTRPNATPFYSLAPEYFKAEMLAIDGAKPEETIDAWIRDPYSRSLVFTTKFTSVGAACFKCNGLNCVVVALGY